MPRHRCAILDDYQDVALEVADWSKVAGYDKDSRDALRDWAEAHEGQFGDVHYFVQSRVVAMALSVAALTLSRRLFTHVREEPFHAALEQRLAG